MHRDSEVKVLAHDPGKKSCAPLKGMKRSHQAANPAGEYSTLTKSMPACVVAMEACCGAHHRGGEPADNALRGVQERGRFTRKRCTVSAKRLIGARTHCADHNQLGAIVALRVLPVPTRTTLSTGSTTQRCSCLTRASLISLLEKSKPARAR